MTHFTQEAAKSREVGAEGNQDCVPSSHVLPRGIVFAPILGDIGSTLFTGGLVRIWMPRGAPPPRVRSHKTSGCVKVCQMQCPPGCDFQKISNPPVGSEKKIRAFR